jgi:predicted nucleic acid-binding protein
LIFLDTGFLYALIDADDANHVRVCEHRFTAVPGPIP